VFIRRVVSQAHVVETANAIGSVIMFGDRFVLYTQRRGLLAKP
jgi:hypothetical protein